MTAMTRVRLASSASLLVLVVLLVIGWIWTAAHQTPSQAFASHVIQLLGIAAALGALLVLWRRPAAPR